MSGDMQPLGPVRNEISRRNVLRIMGITAAGAASAGALAACAPAQPNDGSGNSPSGGEIHFGWPYQAPPEGVFNPLVPTGLLNGSPYLDLILTPSAYYLWDAKQWVNLLVESFGVDDGDKTYTIKLKSGLKWSDDSDFTSADYLATLGCAYIMRQPMWNYMSKVEAPDPTTVLITLKNPSTVLERYLLKRQILPASQYKEWGDKALAIIAGGKTMDDDEGATLAADFQKFAPDNYVAIGPFTIEKDTLTNTQMTMVKNEKSGLAPDVKFEKIVVYNGETDTMTPLVQSKDVDYATHGFAPASEKAFQSAGFRILRPPNYSGGALMLNLEKLPEFKDPDARRALAYAIDRKVNGEVSLGESGVGVDYMAGFSDNQLDDWLSADEKGKLVKYEKSADKAAELLQKAGWKKNGNAWTKPDGSAAKYEVSFPAQYADYSATGKNIAQQLAEFGFDMTPRGVDQAQMPIDVDKGNFQMGIQGWGSSTQPHPYFAFVTDLLTHNIPIAKNNGGKGMNFELQNVQTSQFGTVDIEQLITDAGVGLDADSQKAAVAKLALIFNDLLPMIPLYERYGNNPALEGTRVQKFPADDDPIIKNPAYADNFVVLGMLQGSIVPV